ncbi:lipopolysaccharide assembly protein LapB [Helicobacter sp. MIT 14-3879]|uniref:tetratricopeptide repeat protein n=1 Tax=Helicobacter sp. MIT 14-3879 TaxID=2040649 RepID=UPI000E1E97CC|nr:tetratricopeptide repeat protein [Helicobacter sp. MIT 14-3879]RDU65618.1 hypothetical protein CQA44_01165 [Helicobacter sp. MIT 14-3879]
MIKLFQIIFSIIFMSSILFANINDEDIYILLALEAIDNGDFETAIELYDKLYIDTKKDEYLKEKINILIQLGKNEDAIDSINKYQKSNPSNIEIKKLLAYLYINQRDIDNTIKTYEDIVKLEDNKQNNRFLGNLYLAKKDYKNARKYLLKSYQASNDESTLLIINSIDMELKDFELSIPLIKDYFKDELSDTFAHILIELGSNYGVLDSLESLYLDYYNNKQSFQNAKNLAKLYLFKNKTQEALDLSNKYDFGLDFMIDLYLAKKDYKNAKIQAQKAFEETKNNHYLGVLAIIEFEDAKDKNLVLKSVISNLKKAIEGNENHVFYNYLGYLMIDYDININEGIDYVKLALKISPNNFFYLDSLAWGYYKVNDCKQAKIEIEKIPLNVINAQDEIKEHFEKINKCLVE